MFAVAVAVIVSVAAATVTIGAPAHAAPTAPAVSPPSRGSGSLARLQRTATGPELDRNHVLVKFRSRPADLGTRLARAGASIERTIGRTGWTSLATNGDAVGVKARLAHDPTIARLEPSYMRHINLVPNDTKWSTAQSSYLSPLRMDRAWDIERGSSVIVADLDTGVAFNHPDLAGRIVGTGINEINPFASAKDDNGHGTMTAGIIAANFNNSRGIAGIAPEARILPVKVLDQFGDGDDAGIAAGITAVAALPSGQRPQVINLSLGGPGGSGPLCDAVASARAADIVVVAANGNSSDQTVSYPAGCEGVVAVSATDHSGALTAFSTYGPQTDIAAPGYEITSTSIITSDNADTCATGTSSADVYCHESGTSFSAPIVSGVVALMRARDSGDHEPTIVSRLLSTARDMGAPGRDFAFGYGLVDPVAALGGPRLAPAPVIATGEEPNDTRADATSLAIGSPHDAAFAPETDEDWYQTPTLTAGQWYRATVTGAGASFQHFAQAVVEVYDDENHLLASQEWPAYAGFFAGPTSVNFKISESGTYYLRVRNANASTAPYSVTLTTTSEPPLFTKTPFEFVQDLSSRVQSVGVGDVNGDGRQDIVALMGDGSFFSDNLVVFDQTPARGFVQNDVISFGQPPAGISGGGMVVADANGDGEDDVLVPTTTGIVVIPQSAGALHPELSFPIGDDSVTDLAVADLNNDSQPDVVAAGSFGAEVFFGAGGSDFSAPQPLTALSTRAVAIDNVGGSPGKDVVTVASSGAINAFIHTTGHSFSSTPVGTVANGNSVAIDPDSKDVVVSQRATIGALHRFHFDGSAWGDTTISVASNPAPVAIADIDGDNNPDVVTMHDGTGKIGVVPLAGGTEQLYSTDPEPVSNNDSRAIFAGDIDGDGAADVVAGTSYAFETLIHRYDSLPTNFGGALVAGTNPAARTAGADGNADVTLTLAHPPVNADGNLVKLYGPTGAEVPGTVNVASNVVTFTPDTPLDPGSYSIHTDGVIDNDLPRAETAVTATGFVVGAAPDEVAPTVSFALPPSGFRTTNHESIAFSSDDGTATFYCSKNNAAIDYNTPCTSPVSFTNESPGMHTLRVFARDTVGNESALKTATWTYRPPPDGYWMLGHVGTVYRFGTAPGLGNAPTGSANDLAVSPSGFGYWVVDSAGHVFAFGDAKSYGNASGLLAGETVSAISRTATGKGYWLFTSKGRVFNKGDAKFFGDLRAKKLAGPVLDSVATPSGQGYYMVASDGGVFSFGNAHYYGSKGGQKLAAPVRTLTPDPDGVGYWLVGTNGAVYSFQATYHGSMAGTRLAKPVVGMVSYGNGYLMVAADGGIFNFSSKPFKGSLGGSPPKIPIVSVAVYP